MWTLGHRLKKAGFKTYYFNYSTTRVPFEETVSRVRKEIVALGVPEVNLVGHSLGGLVSVASSQKVEGVKGSIVALGSPFLGSAAGQWVSKHPIGSRMLGGAGEVFNLAQDITTLGPGWRCGVIAGTRGFGIGMFTRNISRPHDGTVALAETYLPNAEHDIVNSTHNGLLLSSEAAALVLNYLKFGTFKGNI